jgi:hypothetical protein
VCSGILRGEEERQEKAKVDMKKVVKGDLKGWNIPKDLVLNRSV